jgi:hypothetical protein
MCGLGRLGMRVVVGVVWGEWWIVGGLLLGRAGGGSRRALLVGL